MRPVAAFKALAIAAIAGSALTTVQPAKATIIDYSLDTFTGTWTTPPLPGPYGKVELNDNGGSNVTVTVSLNSGEGFVSTGAGESLLWDMTGSPSLTITGLTSGFSFDVNGTGTGNMDGTGSWDYSITCNGTACGNGGSSPYVGTLSFTIENVKLSDFIANSKPFYFGSDICTSMGADDTCAGSTGDIASKTLLTSVPEPGALALLAGGLAALGFAVRRRADRS